MSSFPLVNGLPYPPNPIGPIVSVGTVQGTDFVIGTGGPSTKSSLSARAPRQGLLFNGTAGATTSSQVSSFGTADFTVAAWVSVSSLSANNVICDGSNAFAFYIATDGSLRRLDRINTFTAATAAGVITTGKVYFVAYVRGSFYVNGILQTTFSDAVNYTGNINRIGWAISTDSYCTGLLSGPYIYNRALTAAEVVSLYESGVPAGSDYNSASNTNLISNLSRNSTFSAGATDWNTNGGGTLTVSGSALSMSGGLRWIQLANSYTTGGATAGLYIKGKRTRVTFTYSSGAATQFTPYLGGAAMGPAVSASTGTTVTLDLLNTVSDAPIGIVGNGDYTITNISFTQLGLLLAPDAAQAGGGLAWTDASGNGIQIVLPASGVSWNVAGAGTYALRGSTSTNGNQQLVGTTSLAAGSHVTMAAIRCLTGTPTVTLGTSSGGNQLANAVTLATNTWTEVTVKAGGNITQSAGSIWVNSNSTDVIQLCFIIQPLSA